MRCATGVPIVLVGALRDRVPRSDVEQQHLFDDPLAIIVRAGHPLAGRRAPRRARPRRAIRWIIARDDSPLRRQFEGLFRRARMPPPGDCIECNSMVAARELLLDSDRVTLLSVRQVGARSWPACWWRCRTRTAGSLGRSG